MDGLKEVVPKQPTGLSTSDHFPLDSVYQITASSSSALMYNEMMAGQVDCDEEVRDE
jgi:hypothetical protein